MAVLANLAIAAIVIGVAFLIFKIGLSVFNDAKNGKKDQ